MLYYSLAISIGSFILCFNTVLNGQSSFQVSQHFTTANGLSSNNITEVFRDSRGLLWIGTENGLNCYNGKEFTIYNSSNNTPIQISNDFINDIAEDSLGRMWVATNNGLNVMDLVKKSNQIIRKAVSFQKKKGIKFNSILKGEGDIMWACDENSLYQIDANLDIHIIPSRPLNIPRHLTKDKKGMIWGALYSDFGFFKFDPKKEKITIYSNSVHIKLNQSFKSTKTGEEYIITNDSKNNIIGFTESSKLLFNLNIETGTVSRYKAAADADASFGAKLLYILDPYVNEKWIESYNPWCNAILLEDANQIWVATIRGLFLLKNNNAVRIKKIPPLDDLSLRVIYEVNEEKIYVGSYNGFYNWNPRTNKLQLIDSDIFICSISPYNGDTLLMSSDPNRLCLLNKTNDEIYPYQFVKEGASSPYKFFSILKDDKDSLWLGSFKLNRHPGQPDSLSLIKDCSGKAVFKAETVYVIKKGKIGDLWIGTNRGLYNKNGCSITYYDLLTKEESVYTEVAVNDIYEKDDSTVIIGSKYKGLYIFNPQKQTFKRLNQFNGLSDNKICSIVSGNNNDYWVSTFNGLNHISAEHEIIKNYDETDGLINNEFNSYSSCKRSNGDILFGGITGCTLLEKNTNLNKLQPLNKLFGYKKINIANNQFEEFYFDGSNPSVTLNANEHYIEFFLKNSYSVLKAKSGYAYSLKGFDKGFIHHNSNQPIRYTNLDAGQYSFFIEEVNDFGEVETFSARLIVKQYFYESDWFKATIGLGLLSLLYLINYYRLYQKRVATQFKEKLVNDLHDDIGGSLNNIQRIIVLLQNQNIPIEEVKKELTQISQLSNKTVINMSDVIWAVNPDYSTIKDLITRIKDMADEIFPILKIPFDLQIQNVPIHSSINFKTRYQLLMICKEGFTNITKHAENKQVLLKIKEHKGQFVLHLQNEFTKKKTNAKSSLIGLKSIEKRAKTLNGTIEIINQEQLFALILKIKKFH